MSVAVVAKKKNWDLLFHSVAVAAQQIGEKKLTKVSSSWWQALRGISGTERISMTSRAKKHTHKPGQFPHPKACRPAIIDSMSLLASPMFSGHSCSSTISLSFVRSSIGRALVTSLIWSFAQCRHFARSTKFKVLEVTHLRCGLRGLRVRAPPLPLLV